MKPYRTSDIVLASVLKVQGAVLVDIELQGMRGVFVFEDTPQALLTQFDLGTVLVEPNSFHQTVKQLTTAVRRKQSQ